ncbi:hypothetical protein [Yoonia algicola]|uniref:Uncharacterized protein n=1 Tax=Yoonia algicola TaxID=3137368 RepID=A0AAN0NIR3_9RHOB
MRPENEPNLMRLYLRHCAIGFGLSAVFVALILWYDVAGLGGLIAGSDVGYLAVFLLWFFNGTVFGSVQFAIVVMSQADDDGDDDRRGPLIPIRVEAGASRGQ